MMTSPRQAAIYGLAVVGFAALVALGIWLAIYSSRYVPTAVGRLGAAAVSLSEIFTSATEPSLSVVPTASTTISFGTAASTTTATPTTTPRHVSALPKTTTEEKTGKYLLGGTGSTTQTLFGLPDLIVSIDAVGYLAATSTDSFVASSTVPAGFRPAVKFFVKNVGTNITGPWRLSASIPTQSSYIQKWADALPSINPGDENGYVMSFDYAAANKGLGQMISITANYDNSVVESNNSNNSASAQLTIVGS